MTHNVLGFSGRLIYAQFFSFSNLCNSKGNVAIMCDKIAIYIFAEITSSFQYSERILKIKIWQRYGQKQSSTFSGTR